MSRRFRRWTTQRGRRSVTGKKRIGILNNYRQDKEKRILLCNYRVGSEGLNLAIANHVICIETWWSPVMINQAIARCGRVGQKKVVHSYRIIIDKSIEESMDEICRAKETIANAYLYSDINSRIEPPKLDKYMLGKIIGYYNK